MFMERKYYETTETARSAVSLFNVLIFSSMKTVSGFLYRRECRSTVKRETSVNNLVFALQRPEFKMSNFVLVACF